MSTLKIGEKQVGTVSGFAIVQDNFGRRELRRMSPVSKAGTGEGSRGGRIIGHTRSGKPIYDAGHRSYSGVGHFAGWNDADHRDAITHHRRQEAEHEQAATDMWNVGSEKAARFALHHTTMAANSKIAQAVHAYHIQAKLSPANSDA